MATPANREVDMNSFSYRDKVVIVTGGSKGIGQGCALVFCRAGTHVVICARNQAEGECVAEEYTLGPILAKLSDSHRRE